MTREEAVRWLTNEKWKNANNKYKKEWNEAFDLAIEALSADAVQGEWLEIEDYNGDYHYQCSVCKDEFYLEYGTPKENGYAYCPSCGSRMKGGVK